MSTRCLLRLSALALLVAAPGGAVQADGWPPRWSPAEGWTVAPAASAQYDVLHADRDHGGVSADGFRRQRMAVNLAGPNGLAAKVEYDAVPGTWTDVFVRLRLGEHGRLRIGQGKTPMGLEALTSHRHLTLLERSPMNALVPGRALGLEAGWAGGRRTLAVAAFDGTLNPERRGPGLFARTTWNWRQTDDDGHRLHLGLAAGTERPDGPVRLRGRPDVSGLPLVLADSGRLDGVARADRLGVEAAWDRGPFTVQAEHLWLRARVPGRSHQANGGYLMASWRPGGESRRYRDGVFEGISPGRRAGAWEFSLRAARLAVEDAAQARQSGHSYALAASWLLPASLRITAQVGRGHHAGGGTDTVQGVRVHGWF
ncbi:MAG: hypothetical protein KF823_08620 [Xanthomonadales bacterium]|nr:hypothetical protein [Xanthomonadales bacterium]